MSQRNISKTPSYPLINPIIGPLISFLESLFPPAHDLTFPGQRGRQWSYIKHSLAAGIISPSTSPVVCVFVLCSQVPHWMHTVNFACWAFRKPLCWLRANPPPRKIVHTRHIHSYYCAVSLWQEFQLLASNQTPPPPPQSLFPVNILTDCLY